MAGRHRTYVARNATAITAAGEKENVAAVGFVDVDGVERLASVTEDRRLEGYWSGTVTVATSATGGFEITTPASGTGMRYSVHGFHVYGAGDAAPKDARVVLKVGGAVRLVDELHAGNRAPLRLLPRPLLVDFATVVRVEIFVRGSQGSGDYVLAILGE